MQQDDILRRIERSREAPFGPAGLLPFSPIVLLTLWALFRML